MYTIFFVFALFISSCCNEYIDLSCKREFSIEVFENCGKINFKKPKEEILRQKMQSLPLVKRGRFLLIPYKVTIWGRLAIHTTFEHSISAISFDVKASPGFVKSSAKKEVNKISGTVTSKFISPKNRTVLANMQNSWNGILCTIQPVKQVHTRLGQNNVVTNFTPPLPAVISPIANVFSYKKEIPEKIVWKNIVAEVVASNNKDVPVGKKLKGKVTISPIPSSFFYVLDSKEKIKIEADSAFEIKIDFGSRKINDALGLETITRYYIDHYKKRFKAIVSKNEDTSLVLYSY